MAGPTRRIVYIVRSENSGWVRDGLTETLTVTAYLSDGTTTSDTAQMVYQPGEREAIMERTLMGKDTSADLRHVTAIRAKRDTMKQTLYADLQRKYA